MNERIGAGISDVVGELEVVHVNGVVAGEGEEVKSAFGSWESRTRRPRATLL